MIIGHQPHLGTYSLYCAWLTLFSKSEALPTATPNIRKRKSTQLEDTSSSSDGEYMEAEESDEEEETTTTTTTASELDRSVKNKKNKGVWVDDGNESYYQKRLEEWRRVRWLERAKRNRDSNENAEDDDEEDDMLLDEGEEGNEAEEVVEFGGGYKLPKEIHDNLFEYQRTGVQIRCILLFI